MRVKITPRDSEGNPYPGAGSFEVESSMMPDGSCFGVEGAHFPASWCEPIPEVTPEYGDIVEVWDDKEKTYVAFFRRLDPVSGKAFAGADSEGNAGCKWAGFRVLARKPMGGLDAHDAIGEFYRAISEADTASAEVIAYNKFLSAILGVPYARVGE